MVIVRLALWGVQAVLRLVVWTAALTWAALWGVGGIALCLIGFWVGGLLAVTVGSTPVSWLLAARIRRRTQRMAMRHGSPAAA